MSFLGVVIGLGEEDDVVATGREDRAGVVQWRRYSLAAPLSV
jgi:hypothetical protein